MKTLLTKQQQAEFLATNWHLRTIEHKWSCRGYGSSRILDNSGNLLGRATGCGYDRYGTALGKAISALFPAEVLKLAKSKCKGRRRTYKQAPEFYGLFFNAVEGRAWLDGGCGSDCMKKILNKIGFSITVAVTSNSQAQTGSDFYTLESLTAYDRKWL